MIARYVPSLAESVARTFALGEASQLQSLFNDAGVADFETDTVRHTFVLPSFDAYYGPFERGGGSTGQALAALPEEIRRAVAKRRGAAWLTLAGHSGWKRNTELPAAGAERAVRNCPPQLGERPVSAQPFSSAFDRSAF
jgi:hypothetical protein